MDSIQTAVEWIKEARYSFYNEQFDQISLEAKDFISALLQKLPKFRMTAANALLHPWIKTLVQVGENSWPMARLDVSKLKTFNARRKWHVRNTVIVDLMCCSLKWGCSAVPFFKLRLHQVIVSFSVYVDEKVGNDNCTHSPMLDFHSLSV